MIVKSIPHFQPFFDCGSMFHVASIGSIVFSASFRLPNYELFICSMYYRFMCINMSCLHLTMNSLTTSQANKSMIGSWTLSSSTIFEDNDITTLMTMSLTLDSLTVHASLSKRDRCLMYHMIMWSCDHSPIIATCFL